jgi:hypothetical protein
MPMSDPQVEPGRCPTCYGTPDEPLVLTRPPYACDHPTFHNPPTHDDAESEAGRVERWLICPKCAHGEFSVGTNPFACRGFERLGNAHARTYMVEVAPLTALTQERQLREEAERERDTYQREFKHTWAMRRTAERQLHEAERDTTGALALVDRHRQRAESAEAQLKRCQDALRVATTAYEDEYGVDGDEPSSPTNPLPGWYLQARSLLSHPTSPNTPETE